MSYSIETDKKWQEKWAETGLYKFDPNADGEKLYCLEMFSYPSGANLHLGHWYNYSLTDSWARFKHMQGYNLFHPMGFDSFGLPAENYAIKTGIHPKDSTLKIFKELGLILFLVGAGIAGGAEFVELFKFSYFIYGIVMTIVPMIIGFIFAEKFLVMMNCSSELLPKATIYFKLYFLGVPIFMFYNFCASILRAMGDTKKPMYFLILAGIIKVIFSITFLYFTDLTVEGVAIATIISQLSASILAFATLLRSNDFVHLDFRRLRFYKKELFELIEKK